MASTNTNWTNIQMSGYAEERFGISAELNNNGKIHFVINVTNSWGQTGDVNRWSVQLCEINIGGVKRSTTVNWRDYYVGNDIYSGDVDLSDCTITNGYVSISFRGRFYYTNYNPENAEAGYVTGSTSVAAIIPTVNTPTYTIRSGGYNSIVVADRTTIRVNITGATSSGTITGYELYDGNTLVGNTANTDLVLSSGSHNYKARVKNSYNVWSDYSSLLTVTAQVYTPAVINSTTSQRWSSGSSSGHAQDDGTYARLSLTFTPAKIGNTNLTTTWKAQVSSFTSSNQTTSGAAVFSGSVLGDGTYQVKYSIWDSFISTPIERTDIISMAGRGALDLYFDNGVHGIGFGTAGEAGKANFKFTPYFECNNVMTSLVDVVYPVGSIYMSVNNVNPSSLFPNTTWVQITDTFLYCGSDTAPSSGGIDYRPGNSGGDKNSVAKHIHSIMTGWGGYDGPTGNDGIKYTSQVSDRGWRTMFSETVGVDDGNMPPWLAVYVWKRTV